MTKKITAFFSYATKDAQANPHVFEGFFKKFKEQINCLRINDDFTWWRDVKDLKIGQDWKEEIFDCINNKADIFIIMLSPSWLGSDMCRKEYHAIIEREKILGGKRIFVFQVYKVSENDANFTNEMSEIISLINFRQHKRWSAIMRDKDKLEEEIYLAAEEMNDVINDFPKDAKKHSSKFPEMQPPVSVIDELKKRAEAGDAEAQNELGDKYFYGVDVPKNVLIARQLYEQSALQKDGWGQASLGHLYSYGLGGLKKNEKEAIRLFELSADQGNPYGQVMLGISYEFGGRYLKENHERAFKLYQLSSDQDYIGGNTCLAALYEEGKGIEKNIAEAIRLYKRAATQGDDEAKEALIRLGISKE